MREKIAWTAAVILPFLFTVLLFGAWFDTMKDVVNMVEVEKTYTHWGPLDCGGDWKCDESTCCVRCVNLATGEQTTRCHKRGS